MGETAQRLTLAPGFFLGHYRIVRPLRRDAYGELYVAKHAERTRNDILRLLDPGLARDPEAVARFRSEGERLLSLQHPHIAVMREVGEEFGYVFWAGESPGGDTGDARSLADEIGTRGLPESRVRELLRQISGTLACAHAQQVVHGDLHPAAILFADSDRVKIVDFGLVSALGRYRAECSACASPERRAGDPVSMASDMYSLGAILYRMLTGSVFEPGSPAPSACGCREVWDRIVTGCVHPDPSQRFASVETLLSLLEHRDERPQRRRQVLALAAVLAAAVVLAGVAIGLGRWALQRRRDLPAVTSALPAPPMTTAAPALAAEEDVAALLDAARAALADMEYGKASARVTRVLAREPQNREALSLQEEITLVQDPVAVERLQKQAAEAWADIEDMDAGQGLDDALNAVWRTLQAADKALGRLRYGAAVDGYRKVLAECRRLQGVDRERRETAAGRAAVESARAAAWSAGAAEAVPRLWEKALGLAAAGDAQFEQGKFQGAGETWRAAEGAFAVAQAAVKGAEIARAAKATFEMRRADVDTGLMQKAAPDKWRELEEAVSAAEQSATERKWQEAVKSWRHAASLLGAAEPAMAAAARVTDYEAAMARGQDAFQAGRWGEAEYAFYQALKIEGYEDDALARERFAASRQARRGIAVFPKPASYYAAALRSGNSLLPNGGFDEGHDGQPAYWSKVDNLTSLWVDGGVSGKCLRMNTTIRRVVWEEYRKDPSVLTRTERLSSHGYDAIGGTAGVALYSYPVPVEEDAWYLLAFDIKAPGGEPFVWVKGYWQVEPEDVDRFGKDILFFLPNPEGPAFSLAQAATGFEAKFRRQPRPGDFIQCYRGRCVCRYPGGEADTWRHYERAIHLPRRLHAEVVFIQPYGFWPPGDYLFDNITFRRITEAEAQAYEARRQQLGEAANFGRPVER